MQSIIAPAKRMIVDSLLTNFILSVFINRLTNSIKRLVGSPSILLCLNSELANIGQLTGGITIYLYQI